MQRKMMEYDELKKDLIKHQKKINNLNVRFLLYLAITLIHLTKR